ncbi:MAG: MFS transporter [Candidatus Lokiarchaeota archaeon]|nr:MFS transporter [Candidatus Lokiarchaeota archaeon]
MPENTENEFIIEERNKFGKPKMSPNTPGKLKYGRTFLIGLAFFTCSLAWTYYNNIMPLILREYMEAMGLGNEIDVLVGVIMVLDNIVAIFLLPVFGSLSDRMKSKYGKRTPFIVIGVISAMTAFYGLGIIYNFPGVAAFWALILVIMWFNISMAFFRSPAVALMPDMTDPNVRSTGNAIINLMGAVAMVFGTLTPTIARFLYGPANQRTGGFFIVVFITIIGFVIFYLTIKETPTGDKFMRIGDNSIALDPVTLEYIGEKKTEKREPLLEALKNIFIGKERSALFMLLVIFTWFFGYNAINTWYSTYATAYLGWEEADAIRALSLAPIAMIITAIFAGKIAEWIGRRLTIFIGLVGLALGFGAVMFIRDPEPQGMLLTVLFIIIGIFYGLVNINTIVIIWEMAPKNKIGSYTGAYYFFSQMSDTLSPVVAGGLFSLYKAISGVAQGQQYVLLFPYAIFCLLVAMIFLSRVKRGESAQYYERKERRKNK